MQTPIKNPQGIDKTWISNQIWVAGVSELFDHYYQRALSVSAGRNRICFVMPHGYVVKLPRNGAGSGDNLHEANEYRLQKKWKTTTGEQYAKARVIQWQGGAYIGFMEYVKPLTHNEIPDFSPAWVWQVDCLQVGLTKLGRLVIYDFGLN